MTSIRKEYSGDCMHCYIYHKRQKKERRITWFRQLCCVCVKHNSVLYFCFVCVCRWVDGDEAMYTNWSQSFPPSTENGNNWDCVKFAADGWRLQQQYCAVSDLPFVCKMRRKLDMDILSTGSS